MWDKIKAHFNPIKKTHQQRELPDKLRVRRKNAVSLSNVLDLHHKTIQEAYVATQDFIQKHARLGTKNIQIITGKGRLGQGAIRSEFEGWLDTPKFRQYIRTNEWTNDKGAMNLCLKKTK
ncbi:MAG: Smr/MutS family protein [Alphaproteobacteria bacterium]|nr:Smr/MutS family protein [Alphaproteobacteria bacterium]